MIAPIVLILVAPPGLFVLVSYNRFVRRRNRVEESWKQVDVELQRRYELIADLVSTVTASVRFEQTTLDQVTAARTRVMQVRDDPGAGRAAQGQAEQQLSDALRGFTAVAESYPDLQSSQNFRSLQAQLAETEDRVAAGRRTYNGHVKALNVRVESLPSNLVASAFKFSTAEYFELTDQAAPVAPNLSGAFDGPNGPVLTPPAGRVPVPGGQPPVAGPPTPPDAPAAPNVSTPPQGFAAQVPPDQAQTPPQGFPAQQPPAPGQPGAPRPAQP